jgi:hypothetical protein
LSNRAAWWFAACLLVQALAARGQVRLGELTSSMSGTVAPGYSATFGNQTNSAHAWTMGGTADLNGAFHSPGFLSYDVGLYLNQSRANSDFQSISNASGVNASTTIFGGSEFPGMISYSKAYNTEGNYGIPGIANYVTHGNSDSFSINWSENIPRKPSLSAGFATGGSRYSVYGANDTGSSRFHSLNLHSSYQLAGFNMGAFYADGASHSLVPQFITGTSHPEIDSDSGAYGFNVAHPLPLHGSASGTYTRSRWDTSFLGEHSTGAVNLLSTVAAVHPWTKLSFSGSASYSDNLAGQIVQSVIQTGAAAQSVFDNNSKSNSLDMEVDAGYSPQENLQTNFSIQRRVQSFMGETYGVTSYAASASYARALLDGNFSAGVTGMANRADNSGQDTLGASANGTYTRRLHAWHLNASFGYAQNVQTLLVTYMNSHYQYSGGARRNWGKLSFGAAASGGHSGLTQQAGSISSSQGYNATLGYGGWATVAGSYSRSSGQAIPTGAGLVPLPLPPPVIPSSLVTLYGGNSYAFSLSASPGRKLMITASYGKSISNTSSTGITSENSNAQFNTLLQYHYRKLNFTSGYARLEQGFSGSGTMPQVVSSYYFGASRWFKFF